MRIRIIKGGACCLAQNNNGRYEIRDVCVDDCDLDYEYRDYVNSLTEAGLCITKCVELEEQFFFSILRFFKKKYQERCDCIGHLTKDGDIFVLNIDRIIGGNKLYPEDHHRFLIVPLIPDKLFFNNDFSRSVLTSDGVITLEQDQFIGVRDGLIEELDVSEVLEIIAKGKTETSPLFSSIRLNPVTKRPTKPRKGTIIYNKNSDKMEVYNGQEWIQL
jgi:hypothetical protein